jgi:uncharacterized membrane protein YgdD (TMEM256/DUF423 family)
MKNFALVAGAIFGFVGVALGAFGAHGLESVLKANERLDTWHTAVLYQFVHAGLLLFLGLWQLQTPAKRLRLASIFACIGVGIFSGSLYLLSLTNIKWLGAITPIGGLCFLIAWALIIFHSISNKSHS